MAENKFDMGPVDIAWCPGCGNFSILKILKQTLTELGKEPGGVVFSSGIGQAAKMPQYLKCNFFNGLHGRSLPVATAIKAANPGLLVIAESGDGCNYGEGGNHFMHTIRRNPDILHLVHDNMIYGLTKGQASPTTRKGFTTPVQVDGVFSEPFNPLAVAIALGASFVARAFAGDQQQSVEIVKKAIEHRGYALVDILQPCPSYNKLNTYKWFKDHVYYLDSSHDPADAVAAMKVALDLDRLALGVVHVNAARVPFEKQLRLYKESSTPLVERPPHDMAKLREIIASKP